MQNLKISVVIPVYNGERWVAQSIEGVLRQSYKNLEVIVVDDGSTDATGEIAARYPVKLITQKNKGLAGARNTGLAAATGDYIHFMDVDDLINLHYYERMAEAAELTGADIVLGGTEMEGVPRMTLLFSETLLLATLSDKVYVTRVIDMCSACRYMSRLGFLKEHNLRFDEQALIEDLPFTLKAFPLADAVVTVPGAIYYYVQRQGSIMHPTTREARQRYDLGEAEARRVRREFIAANNLADAAATRHERHIYKILGIPGLRKVSTPSYTKWYLWGIRLMRRKRLE